MAYNDDRILIVLIGELEKVPERCEGYRENLRHLLRDVLRCEEKHTLSRRTIVKDIASLVNKVGMNLYKSRPTEG